MSPISWYGIQFNIMASTDWKQNEKNYNYIPGSSYLLYSSQLAGSDLAKLWENFEGASCFFGLIFTSVLIVKSRKLKILVIQNSQAPL